MRAPRRSVQYLRQVGATVVLVLAVIWPSVASSQSVITYQNVAARQVVAVDQLVGAAPLARPSPAFPFRPRDPGLLSRARSVSALANLNQPTAPLTLLSESSQATAAAVSPQSLASFPLISLRQQFQALGADQIQNPPDTQIAVGPRSVLELVNASGSVWSKTGVELGLFDLNAFFDVPDGYGIGDPRVLYDRQSGRWLASAAAIDAANDSQVYLAVSLSDDPLGSWIVYTSPTNGVGILADQPKLGVSDDKIVLSWNEYTGSPSRFSGEEIWILDKSSVLAGDAVVSVGLIGPDPARFGAVPVWSLSSTSDLYLVYNNTDPYLGKNQTQPTLGVVAISGTPSGGNLARQEWDLPMLATTVPPNALQPGAAPAIATGDDRLLGAVWQNDTLWTSANDACQPAGEATPRACFRLIQVDTSQATPRILQSLDVAAAGADVFNPVVTVDALGNAFIGYGESSASAFPSFRATVQRASDATNGLSPSISLATSLSAYDACGTNCEAGGQNQNRWGDYSGASVDPVDPSRIWLAGEYVPSAADPAGWGTSTAELTLGSGAPAPGSGHYRLFFPSIGSRAGGSSG